MCVQFAYTTCTRSTDRSGPSNLSTNGSWSRSVQRANKRFRTLAVSSLSGYTNVFVVFDRAAHRTRSRMKSAYENDPSPNTIKLIVYWNITAAADDQSFHVNLGRQSGDAATMD